MVDEFDWDTMFDDGDVSYSYSELCRQLEIEEKMDCYLDTYTEDNVSPSEIFQHPPNELEITSKHLTPSISTNDTEGDSVIGEETEPQGFKKGVLDFIYTPRNKTTAKKYSAIVMHYLLYCDREKRLDVAHETNFCNYFHDCLESKEFGVGSVWTIYAGLNNWTKKRYRINLNTYSNLRTMMTNLTRRHIPKKSSTLTSSQFETLVDHLETDSHENENHDATIQLVAALLLWYGLLRGNEVFMIDMQDVVLDNANRTIHIHFSKPTKTRTSSFSFQIPSRFFNTFYCYKNEIREGISPSTRFLKNWSEMYRCRYTNTGRTIHDRLRATVTTLFPDLDGQI